MGIIKDRKAIPTLAPPLKAHCSSRCFRVADHSRPVAMADCCYCPGPCWPHKIVQQSTSPPRPLVDSRVFTVLHCTAIYYTVLLCTTPYHTKLLFISSDLVTELLTALHQSTANWIGQAVVMSWGQWGQCTLIKHDSFYWHIRTFFIFKQNSEWVSNLWRTSLELDPFTVTKYWSILMHFCFFLDISLCICKNNYVF